MRYREDYGSICSVATSFGRGTFISEIGESSEQKKRPESTDFEVKVFDAGADVIFKPTSSYYWFSRFADFADIVRYGHLSQSTNVRHTGLTGDTDGYDPNEVLAEARRVALRTAMDAYEKNE